MWANVVACSHRYLRRAPRARPASFLSLDLLLYPTIFLLYSLYLQLYHHSITNTHALTHHSTTNPPPIHTPIHHQSTQTSLFLGPWISLPQLFFYSIYNYPTTLRSQTHPRHSPTTPPQLTTIPHTIPHHPTHHYAQTANPITLPQSLPSTPSTLSPSLLLI